MFGMLPFERSDDNLFDTFDNFTRNFFRGSNASLPAFRTDIKDQGDHYLLEADLPGMKKEDIAAAFEEAKKNTKTPTIIEFIIDPEEMVYPMIKPGGTLEDMIMDC